MDTIARSLLETHSVHINPASPFRLASGRLSPVYVDCRRLISFPDVRRAITQGFARIARDQIGLKEIDVIAGGETAGIPYAAFLAVELRLPMIYVRKAPKGHGKTSQIEGILQQGQRTLLVEDLATDGGSKLNFKKGIEAAGGILEHCLCVFEYRSQRAGLEEARATLATHGIKLHSLCDWDELLTLGQREEFFSKGEAAQVFDFLRDPEGWSQKHRGAMQ
jgi:orotate phosphoribosyltransferase